MRFRFPFLAMGFPFAVLLLTHSVSAQTGIPGYGQRPLPDNVGALPDDWHPGRFDRRTGAWQQEKARNVKWVVQLGSQTYGSPIVAGGKVFVGTNNGAGYLPRYPNRVDLGCLLCFREEDGKFLWQFSAEKLPTGRVNDWPLQGIQSSPYVEGKRAWFVSNRAEIICIDIEGHADKKDDGEPHEVSSVFYIPREDIGKSEIIDALDQRKASLGLARFIASLWKVGPEGMQVEVMRPGHSWRVVGEKTGTTATLLRDYWGIRVALDGAKPTATDADVIWRLNLMEKFGAYPHNNSNCCVTCWKETLFLCTGNGVDETHLNIPAPNAPSFVALDKSTGKVLWTSNLPGKNIHHGNWSSPAVGVVGGVPQVIFNGGDGWTYSFHAEDWRDGQPQLLWKFDTNPKEAELILGGRGTRNEPIAPPVIHEGRVYVTVGQDAEHGDGVGCIWCIDPAKRGDVSEELAVMANDHRKMVPYDGIQAVRRRRGEEAIANPNSAVIWKYLGADLDQNGKLQCEESMHRTIAPVVISGDLLFCNDFSGVIHCLNAKSGKAHWSYDLLAACWSPPLVADGKVYCCDEDGDVAVFFAHGDPEAASGKRFVTVSPAKAKPYCSINMTTAIYTQPTASKGVLFIANKDKLFAIQGPRK